MRNGWLLVAGLLGMMLFGCAGEQRDRFVDDPAGALSAAARTRIENYHAVLLRDCDIHFHLTLLPEAEADIDAKAVRLFEAYRLGAKTRAARGVLLLIDPQGKQARLEIGYDLEGIFPDGFVAAIEREQMVPFFSAGKLGPGIEATVELLVARAAEWKDKGEGEKGSVAGRYSGGAGARTPIAIGSGAPEKASSPEAGRFTAAAEPLLTLEKYREALSLRIKDPELGIFTPETRRFFRQWLVTDAQQENEFRALSRNLSVAEVRISGARAVISFPVVQRQAAPYFLQRGSEGWMLDFAGMSRWIAFNHNNQGHFKTFDHPYRFAFEHLTFDRHGFPHEKAP